MKDLALNYLTILFQMFQYDIHIFSQKWVLYSIVPGFLYLMFFFIKWVVLTTPIWMPFSIIFSSLRIFGKK